MEPNSQRAVCKQQLHKHSNKMTHKISVRNYVLFKSWFSCSSRQGVRIHRGQTLSTPGDLQSKKKRKKKRKRSSHLFLSFSNRSFKRPGISKKTDPTYRKKENWVIKADQWLSFLCLLCWPDSCRGIPGEKKLKGRSMGMGGVNQ